MKFAQHQAREFFLYGAGSAIAFGVDLGLLIFTVRQLDWNYLLAASFSFAIGSIVAYVFCIRFVFRFRRIADRRAEFVFFLLIGIAGLVINALMMAATVQ